MQGWLYTNTDVKDLHEWMVAHLDAHPLFRRLRSSSLEVLSCVHLLQQE